MSTRYRDTRAEYQRIHDRSISEAALQRSLIEVAEKSIMCGILTPTEYVNGPAMLATSEAVTQEVSAPMCSKSNPNPSQSTNEFELLTRQDAVSRGFTTYFTGEPCKNGHVSLRFASNRECTECSRIRKAEYQRSRNNADKNAYMREWRSKNPVRARHHHKQWAGKNREHVRSYAHRWRSENRIMVEVNQINRKARDRGATGVINHHEWAALLDRYGSKCLACGAAAPDTKIVADHVIPVSQGGENTIDNIQPLCIPCNSRKFTNSTDYRGGLR